MKPLKSCISVCLSVLMIFSLTISSYASQNSGNVILNPDKSLTIFDNGENFTVTVDENDDFNVSTLYDSKGNFIGKFTFNKLDNTVTSSITGKSIILNSPTPFTSYSKHGFCEPGDTDTEYASASYAEILGSVGEYVVYATLVAFLSSLFGVTIYGVFTKVIDGVSIALANASIYGADYLNSHGLSFKREGTCKYDHRAQFYVMRYHCVDYSLY